MILLTPTGTVGNNFNTYVGTAASLPSDFTVSGSTTNYVGVFTDGVSAYTTANGLYAGTESPITTDTGFAARVPVGTNLMLTWSVENDTGAALNGLSLSYTEVQYQDAVATPNTISLASDDGNGGSTFDATNLTGNTSVNELSATGGGLVYATPETKALTATYNKSIANGATVQFQFTWTPGGGGNRPIFGITDLNITGITSVPVPEPSTVVLFLSAAAGLIVVGKRRRQSA
jgi:hypothetical protein